MLEQPWRIQLLGGLRAASGSRVVDRFRTEKTGALLGYLALHIDHAVSRDDLVELLWFGSDIDRGRMSLRTALSSLRRQLEPPGTAIGSVVFADHSTIMMNSGSATTDVSDFLKSFDAAVGPDADRFKLLADAVRFYRGPLLPSHYDDWIVPDRERLAAMHLNALRQLTRHHAACRELTVALGYAQEAVRSSPVSEELHRDLIRLYLALGNSDAAARQMESLIAILETELGRSPSEATALLHDEIRRRGASSASFVRSNETSVHSAIPQKAESPEATSLFELRSRIPPRFTRFFGREREIAQIGDLLRAEGGESDKTHPRVLTITGPGGTGKTRLALEISAGASADPGAHIYFVPLEDVSDSRLICPKISEVMGLEPNASMPALDQVCGALQNTRALLVLDNLEQIADSSAGVVFSLVSRLPDLTCLVTSRRRLELPGELEIPLNPLPVPGQETDMELLARIPSVQLFVDRAQAARTDFQLTRGNAEAISAICTRLEGMPLAIELAAARSKVLTPAQMLQNLEERFTLLASRRADKTSRHRSLWAAIDWSYGLLSKELQSFFAGTSVFRGGWTWKAAEEICGEPRALEYLSQLRGHSLVVAEEAGEEMRFRLLESIREFAQEHLSETRNSRLADAHARYYLMLAEEAEPQLTGQDQADWMLRLQAEHDNIRAALERSLACGNVELAAKMGAAIWRFWWVRGYADEGRRWLERTIDERRNLEPALLARALHGAGTLAWASSDCESAEKLHLEALDVRQKLGDLDGAARSLGSLGNARREMNDTAGARTYYQKSLDLFRQVGDTRNVATSLLNLGTVVEDGSDLVSAREYYCQSLELYRELGDRYSVALALANIGSVDISQRKYSAAFAALKESAEIRREIGANTYLAATLSFFAQLYLATGDLELAIRLLGASAAQLDAMSTSIPMSSFAAIQQDLFSKTQAAVPRERFEELLSEGRVLSFDEAYEAAISGYSPELR